MRSIKSVLVALMAVLAFGAVVASGASAHEYFIEGKSMKELGLKEEAVTATSSTSVTLTGSGISTITCTSSTGTGTIKEGGTGAMTIEVKGSGGAGCTVGSQPHCEVKPFVMHSTSDELVEVEGKLSDRFSSTEANEKLFTLEIVNKGGSCAEAGVSEVRGHLVGRVSSEVDSEVVTLSFNSSSGTELEESGAPLQIKFTDQLKLSGAHKGGKWSARK